MFNLGVSEKGILLVYKCDNVLPSRLLVDE